MPASKRDRISTSEKSSHSAKSLTSKAESKNKSSQRSRSSTERKVNSLLERSQRNSKKFAMLAEMVTNLHQNKHASSNVHNMSFESSSSSVTRNFCHEETSVRGLVFCQVASFLLQQIC